jgi:nucleolar protein 14
MCSPHVPPLCAPPTLETRPRGPQELEERRAALSEKMGAACEACVAQRKKLVRRAGLAAPEIKQYNPRFEEEFVPGKDYDPDRSKAEERKLKRQVRKETRSAMRELRKDADFLGAQKAAERAAADAERRAEYRRGFALLQQQEADFKSGGQKGMWKKGKKLR